MALAKAAAHAKAAATEVHGGTVAAHGLLHAAVEPDAARDGKQDGHAVDEQHVGPKTGALVSDLGRVGHPVLVEALGERVVAGPLVRAIRHRGVVLGGERDLARASVERDLTHLVVIDHVDELAVGDVLDRGALDTRVHDRVERDDGRDRDDRVQDHRLSFLLVVHSLSLRREPADPQTASPLGSCTAKDTQGTIRITALRKTLCSPPLGQVSRAIGVEQGREVVYLGADMGTGVGVGHDEGALVHLELVVV